MSATRERPPVLANSRSLAGGSRKEEEILYGGTVSNLKRFTGQLTVFLIPSPQFPPPSREMESRSWTQI